MMWNFPIANNINIKGISCGKNHCVAWDEDGMVYTWGQASDGKLGHPIEYGSKFEKIQVVPKKVKEI